MLYQLHWQFKDGHTDMRAQKELGSKKEHFDWIRDVQTRHPLPEGAKWIVCNEESKYFVWAVKSEDIGK